MKGIGFREDGTEIVLTCCSIDERVRRGKRLVEFFGCSDVDLG